MDKIFSPIKGRITIFIENQGIKKEDFYNKTDISPSNFKGKGAVSEIGGDKIAKILTEYEDINPDWLLTGQGSMLRTTTPVESSQTTPQPKNDDVIALLKEQLKEKEVELKESNQEIGQLKLKNKELEEKMLGLDLSGLSSSRTRAHSQDVTSANVPLKK